MILKREAIEHFNKKLSLPFTGIEQDWDLEMSDSSRVDEFVSCYKREVLSIDEKVALMALILASYEDFLNEHEVDSTWDNIKDILQSERGIFSDLLAYWNLSNENSSNNYFKITPLLRDIRGE